MLWAEVGLHRSGQGSIKYRHRNGSYQIKWGDESEKREKGFTSILSSGCSSVINCKRMYSLPWALKAHVGPLRVVKKSIAHNSSPWLSESLVYLHHLMAAAIADAWPWPCSTLSLSLKSILQMPAIISCPLCRLQRVWAKLMTSTKQAGHISRISGHTKEFLGISYIYSLIRLTDLLFGVNWVYILRAMELI